MRLSKLRYFITYGIVLILWDLGCRFGWLKISILPPPLEVLKTLGKLIESGEIIVDAATSLGRVFIGFLIACGFGITLGILTGVNRHFREYMTPILEILRPIPPVAFVPISILWFGIGNGPAYFLVSFGAFFPIFTNALTGITLVNPMHLEAALCLGANRRLILTDILLPASVPYLMAGLKTGLGTAWFCVIVAELVGAQSGLGYMIQLNRLTLQSEKVLSGMIAIGFLGYFMNRGMSLLQRLFVPWQSKSVQP